MFEKESWLQSGSIACKWKFRRAFSIKTFRNKPINERYGIMLAADIENKIPGIVSKIVEFYKPELIILFGSFANNQYTEDSDLDLLVVKNTRKHPLWRRVEVRKVIQTDIPVDIVVFTPSEFARLRESGSAFIEEILKEGKILYQREMQVLV